MIKLIFVLALVIGALWLLRWFLKTPSKQVANRLKKNSIYIVAGLLILLAASGRLNWIVPLVGAFLAVVARSLPGLLRYAPILHRLWLHVKAGRPDVDSANTNQSTVNARFVRMTLDHRSGEIGGEVLEGQYKGRHFHELSKEQIIMLYQECVAVDGESASLVEVYLDRIYGQEWQSEANYQNHHHQQQSNNNHGGAMNTEEAYQILGLSPAASKRDIIDAHRRLIQKLHPDRGGSDYLAAKINKAKDILLSS